MPTKKKDKQHAHQLPEASIEFLKRFVETPSPSGFEQPAQRLFRERVGGYCDEVSSDVMGNSWGTLRGKTDDAPRVMIAGHCDEIGFMVKHVDKEGFVYVGTIGGHDRTIFPGQRLDIHTSKGVVRGVFGRKPVHFMAEAERAKVGKLHEHYVDIGAGDEDEALKMVALGDVATYAVGFERLGEQKVISRAFDDKMGAFVVSETMKLLSEGKRPTATVFGVSTVQEEIGLRGAKTSSFALDPDVAIVVEVTFASDQPDMDKRINGDLKIGKGPVVSIGANINPKVYELLTHASKKSGIPIQVSPSPGATGTDASVIQLSRGGVATGLVCVPIRYMHTPVELLSLADLAASAELLAEFIRSIDKRTDFVPA